jgi:2-oxoglutarate ferredoxin oxidoreductase subunit alpha
VGIERGKLLSREALLAMADYKRYELTADGISPRALPSFKNGIHLVESLEHDEKGYRDEDDANRVRMMEKRMRKLERARPDLAPPKLWGDRQAEIAFLGFGSTLGAILETMDRLREKGLQAKLLQLRTLWPFPAEAVRKFLGGAGHVFVVENNFSAPLVTLIKSQVNPCREIKSILNYSTRNFTPREIVQPVMRALR